ncbi:hypothetical protein VUR80DRAFT_3134 [Thermomyces stellatus]
MDSVVLIASAWRRTVQRQDCSRVIYKRKSLPTPPCNQLALEPSHIFPFLQELEGRWFQIVCPEVRWRSYAHCSPPGFTHPAGGPAMSWFLRTLNLDELLLDSSTLLELSQHDVSDTSPSVLSPRTSQPPRFSLSPRGWLRQHFRSVQTCFALRTGGAPGALCSCCIQVLGSGASSARLVILILAAARLSFRAIFPGPRADKAIKLAQELLGGLACSSSQAQEPADQYE